MDQERLARLTDQQRTCLRLVYEGLSSKAIAQRLGIEPGSVDQHLKGAMRILGVSGRHTAARLLAESEQKEPSAPPVQFRDMPGTLRPERPERPSGEERRPLPHDLVHEDQMRFERRPPPGAALPLPAWEWKPHHLGWTQRLGLIVAAAVAIALTFAALVAALEAIVRLVSR